LHQNWKKNICQNIGPSRIVAESNLLLLRVRLRSIDSSLQDIKKKRQTLEAQLKSKFIDKKKYQEEMSLLVAEGRKLLVEKERVEKEMKKIKQV